jgi:hypothetical protein
MTLTPSEQVIFNKKIQDVTQGMLNNKRALVDKFGGKKAGDIIQGRAVNIAKKEIENLRQNQEMEDTRLKEMVKMALTKPLDETNIQEDIDLGHEDNEPHDLKSQLYKIGKYAMELYQIMDQFEGKGEVDFPAWWQNKINTAGNMMSSAKHYLDFELKEPKIDAIVGVGDMMNEEINQNDLQSDLQKELKKAFPLLNPEVSVYGNKGDVKFRIRDNVNQKTFDKIIKYLKDNNYEVNIKQSYPDYEVDDDREWFPRIIFTIKGPNIGNSLPNLAEIIAKKLKDNTSK